MNSIICFHANKLFFPVNEIVNARLVAYSYVKRKEPNSEKFDEQFSEKLPVKCSYMNKIFLKTVRNFVSGLQCILILIFDNKGFQEIFLYSASSRKKLTSVTLPRNFIKHVDSSHIFIADGPTFLTVFQNKFCIYSAYSQTVNYFIYHSDDCGLLNYYKILQFNHVTTSSCLYSYIIVACTLNDSQDISVIVFNSIQKSEEVKYVKLPLSIFFPEQYKPSVKAINIVKFIPLFRSSSSNLEDLTCQENITLVCTENDCLVFFNGILKHCCKLSIPMPDFLHINAEIVSSSLKDILIMTNDNGCTYLILLDDNKCEIVKHWTNVEASTIGDVMLNGSKQLILLKDTDFTAWHKHCIVTDVFSLANVEQVSEKIIPDDCFKTTVSGLQQKIQLGKSIISGIEHEISQKIAATTDVLIRLKECKRTNKISEICKTFRESLTDLILYEEESKNVETPPIEVPVKLIAEKQEFIDDDWILSLCFINDSNKFICLPSMKVLIENKQVLCTQKLFTNVNSSSFIENNNSDVDPKTQFTILLKLSMPAVLTNEISFILSWYDGSSSDFHSKIFKNKEEKVLKQHQICFQKRINFENLLNKEIKKGISCLEDLLFKKLLQNKIVLQISSLHSDIHTLKSTLINHDPNIFNLEESNCLVFSQENSLLFGVHIALNVINKKLVSVEAYIKNTREILLFVYFLYHCLPDDILISPSLIGEEEMLDMKKEIICAVKSETDLLFSSLNIHNVADELRKNYTKLMSSQNVGTITIPKETYQRIRKALVRQEFLTDALLRNFASV